MHLNTYIIRKLILRLSRMPMLIEFLKPSSIQLQLLKVSSSEAFLSFFNVTRAVGIARSISARAQTMHAAETMARLFREHS